MNFAQHQKNWMAEAVEYRPWQWPTPGSPNAEREAFRERFIGFIEERLAKSLRTTYGGAVVASSDDVDDVLAARGILPTDPGSGSEN